MLHTDLRFEIFCQIFADNFSIFLVEKFSIFFWTRKKFIFFGVENFLGYSFDVKLSDLSIYDVFRAFGVRQIWFPAPTRYCEGTKTCSISRVFWILVRNQPFLPLWNFFKKIRTFFSKWFFVQKKIIFFDGIFFKFIFRPRRIILKQFPSDSGSLTVRKLLDKKWWTEIRGLWRSP